MLIVTIAVRCRDNPRAHALPDCAVGAMVPAMPIFKRPDGVELHYEESGQGHPLLCIAPGALRSTVGFWDRAPIHPVRELASDFRVITLDLRNAGESKAPISAEDGWHTYVEDFRSLLDHLGAKHCHVLGMCMGGAFSLALAQALPERVTAAVLLQPIGFDGDNRQVFYDLFDGWAKDLAPQHPEATPAVLQSFRSQLYDRDFVFSVTREQVDALKTPLLVLMGNDVYHPSQTSRDIAALSQNARLIERWKEPDVVAQAVSAVREFLQRNTPGNAL